MQVVPAILTDSPSEFKERLVTASKISPRAHLDVIDGVFAPRRTVFPEVLSGFETRVSFDIHLMTREPVNWVEKCLSSGAERVIGQIEMMLSQGEFIQEVVGASLNAGLAIDLATPVSEISFDSFSAVESILVMAVRAGAGGQEFNSLALDKVRELSKIRARRGFSFKIHVDGGVDINSIKKVLSSGADVACVGSGLFEGDAGENWSKLSQAIKQSKNTV